MIKVTFFPLGNADCCRLDLESGKKILFDFADVKDQADEQDLRCDLPTELKNDLDDNNRNEFDVVAFSHLDKDHFKGMSEFFYLEYAEKYQSDDRVKIKEMWVPAAIITEKWPDDSEARILQREARHRFLNGEGIRVFSRPERLDKWCSEHDIKLKDRLQLISDAGTIVPDFSISDDQVEFFVHSPFAVRQDENNIEDRNEDSLMVQAKFKVGGIETKVLFLADASHEVLEQIVDITKLKKNDARLDWDIVKLPHHCSYKSIGLEKGKDITKPAEEVDWLYGVQGQSHAIAISTSKAIPVSGSEEDKDDQPPHLQAANYYKQKTSDLNGQFVVTMEHPKTTAPKPLVIEIGDRKATLKRTATTAAFVATSQSAPRAG